MQLCDFFADAIHLEHQHSCLVVEAWVQHVLRDLLKPFGERLDFVFFHTYRIAQDAQKARNFFTISESIFVDVFSNGRLKNRYDTLRQRVS